MTLKLERKSDWEEKLNDYVSTRLDADFEWGKVDCAMFVAGAVKAMTGTDPARGFHGKYKDEKGARRAIKKIGNADTLPAMVDDMAPRRAKAMARRGDVIFTRDGNLAICWGTVALAVGEDPATGTKGLIRVPPAEWRRAWQIG